MLEEPQSQYEPVFSYRVHFGRMKKLDGGGAVVFGEEERLSSQSLKEAKEEFAAWLEKHKEDREKEIIQSPRLMEIRYVQL
ncbi:MAG TPA: hypothetical protein VJB92_02390 [Candidatus Paceibacterota bacterium]